MSMKPQKGTPQKAGTPSQPVKTPPVSGPYQKPEAPKPPTPPKK